MPSIRTRRARLASAALLSLDLLVAVLLPAPTASAMAVDCTYVRDLAKYVDALGIGCSGGSSSPWTGTAGGPAAAAGGGPCLYHEPDLPDYMARYSTMVTSSRSVKTSSGGIFRVFQTKYYDESGTLYATKDNLIGATGIHATWISDFRASHAPVEIHSYWYCTDSDWGDPSFTNMFPGTGLAPSREGSAHAGISSVTLTSSMRPVPGTTTDQFFYRVDVKSNTTSTLEPLTIDLSLRDFTIASIIGLPPGMSCSAIQRTEECIISVLPSGETRTLTLLLTPRPGTELSTALVSATAEFMSHVRDPLPHDAPLRAATIAPATPQPAPDAPNCGGLAAAPENVVSDSGTTLGAHCSTDAKYPMHVVAQHGSATIDDFGTVRYQPEPGYVGADLLAVTSSSDIALSEATHLSVNVVASATASDDAYSTPAEVPLSTDTILLNDHVPPVEGWLIQTGTTPPSHGTLVLDPASGAFTYTPAPGFIGRDSFQYRLGGRNGAVSNIATVTIDILAR